jgi:hypothetical protein
MPDNRVATAAAANSSGPVDSAKQAEPEYLAPAAPAVSIRRLRRRT